MPPVTAARRMGLSLEAFREHLPALLKRGFPAADEITGYFDLDAIDAWRRKRYPHLFPTALTPSPTARDVKTIVAERVARIRGG